MVSSATRALARPIVSALARHATLPACRVDARGRLHVDLRSILRLGAPLIVNAAVQAVLSLTDTWFIGRISTAATAAMGATYFLVLVFVLLFGGVGLAVQTLVAQAHGARRKRRAAQAVWNGAWACVLTAPVFALLAFNGHALLSPFGLAPDIEALALEYWLPRLIGGPVAVAMWVGTGFFNGIGRTGVTLALSAGVALLNAALNELFMFRLGLGMAGAGWATSAALVVGSALALALFCTRAVDAEYRSRLLWRPRPARIARTVALGLPIGLAVTLDLLALAVFQLMLVRLGTVDGAASQLVLMLTSLCYMPAVGLGMAGTTLVGQSIGAGARDWAMRVGNATIALCAGFMGAAGVLLAAAGPWLIPPFVSGADADADAVVRTTLVLLWLAAAYQAFDGLNIGASCCLRGAGDARVPAALVLLLAWLLYLPLAHTLTFAPGRGWFDGLPQLGWGSVGGWIAAVAYVMALGLALYWRWRSGAWRRIVLR